MLNIAEKLRPLLRWKLKNKDKNNPKAQVSSISLKILLYFGVIMEIEGKDFRKINKPLKICISRYGDGYPTVIIRYKGLTHFKGKQISFALNDPTKGLNLFTTAGVSFSGYTQTVRKKYLHKLTPHICKFVGPYVERRWKLYQIVTTTRRLCRQFVSRAIII